MYSAPIYIKTAPIEDQWLAAYHLNPHMELQLLGDFLDDTFEMERLISFVQQHPIQVQAIHSPLHRGEDIDLAQIEEDFIFKVADKTCQLAQQMAQHYQRMMPVIFHYGGDIQSLLQSTIPAQRFLERLGELYHTYPNVQFLFENVTVIALGKHPDVQPRRYRDADPGTVPTLVRWLRQEFNDQERFYTVLDTCHALMTERLYEAIGLELPIESFFKAHEGLCGLIHFANCHRFGFGADHGTAFTDQDFVLVRQLLTYYQTYHFDCPLTLEINEPCYLTYENYQVTKEVVETVQTLMEIYL